MFFRLLQRSQSDMHISDLIPMTKLEANSRSLSTWVAVGDTSATTQLPSPQVGIITSLLPKAFHEKKKSIFNDSALSVFLIVCFAPFFPPVTFKS